MNSGRKAGYYATQLSTAQQFVSSFLTSARTGLHLHPRCTRSQQDLKLKWQRSIRISVHYPFHVWLREVLHKVYIKEACRKVYWLQWTFDPAETLCILGECDLFLTFVHTHMYTTINSKVALYCQTFVSQTRPNQPKCGLQAVQYPTRVCWWLVGFGALHWSLNVTNQIVVLQNRIRTGG